MEKIILDKKVRLDNLYAWIKDQTSAPFIYAWVEYLTTDKCIKKRIHNEVWKNPNIPVEDRDMYTSYRIQGNKVFKSLFFHRSIKIIKRTSNLENEVYFPARPGDSHPLPPIMGEIVNEHVSGHYLPEWGPIYVATSDRPLDPHFPVLEMFEMARKKDFNLYPQWLDSCPLTANPPLATLYRYYTRITRFELPNSSFIDLETLYNNLVPTREMPFVKYRNRKVSNGDVQVKFFEPITEKYPHIISKLTEWINDNNRKKNNQSGRKRAKGVFEDYLTVKLEVGTFPLHLTPYYVTVTIFPHKVIDLVVKFSNMDNKNQEVLKTEVMPKVNLYLYKLNKMLESVKIFPELFMPLAYDWDLTNCHALLEKNMLRKIDFQFRFPDSYENIQALNYLIQTKFADSLYIHKTDHNRETTFTYKLGAGFASFNNIKLIIQNVMDSMPLLTKRVDHISKVFSLSPELASHYVHHVDSSNDKKKDLNTLHFTTLHFVKKEVEGYFVYVKKCQYFEEVQEISLLLRNIFDLLKDVDLSSNNINSMDFDVPQLELNEDDEDDDDDKQGFDDIANEGEDAGEDEDADTDASASVSASAVPDVIVNNPVTELKPLDPNWKPKEGSFLKNSRFNINNLQQADPELFGKTSGFSRNCQSSSNRQPVVTNMKEISESMSRFPGSVPNYLAYGSNPEYAKNNIYFCPDVWCPYDKVAMTRDQFVEQGSCPSGQPAILNFGSQYFNQKRGYIDFFTENGKCIPCCFKIRPVNNSRCESETTHINIIDKEYDTKDEASKNRDKDRYIIKPDIFPLKTGRLGWLPEKLSNALNPNLPVEENPKNNLSSKKDGVYVRKGTSRNDLLNAIFAGKSEQAFVELRDSVKLKDFILIGNGELFRKFQTGAPSITDREFDALMQDGHTGFEHVSREDAKKVVAAFKNFQNSLSFDDWKSHLFILNRIQNISHLIGLIVFVFKEEDGGKISLECPYMLDFKKFIQDRKMTYTVVYKRKVGKEELFEPIVKAEIKNLDRHTENFFNYDPKQSDELYIFLSRMTELCSSSSKHILEKDQTIVLDGSARCIGYIDRDKRFVSETRVSNQNPSNDRVKIRFSSTSIVDLDNEEDELPLREMKTGFLQKIYDSPDLFKLVQELRGLELGLDRKDKRTLLERELGLVPDRNNVLRSIVLDEIINPIIPLDISYREKIIPIRPRSDNVLTFNKSLVEAIGIREVLNISRKN